MCTGCRLSYGKKGSFQRKWWFLILWSSKLQGEHRRPGLQPHTAPPRSWEKQGHHPPRTPGGRPSTCSASSSGTGRLGPNATDPEDTVECDAQTPRNDRTLLTNYRFRAKPAKEFEPDVQEEPSWTSRHLHQGRAIEHEDPCVSHDLEGTSLKLNRTSQLGNETPTRATPC